MNLDLKLEQVINLLKSQKIEKIDEVKFIVKLLLQNLEWSDKEIYPEYENSKFDFSLNYNGKPLAYLVCKKYSLYGKKFGDLTTCADTKQVPIIVLTDGREWNFLIKFTQNFSSYQAFHSFDLHKNHEITEIADIFTNYLSRSRIISGDAYRTAKEIVIQKQNSINSKKIIQKAWNSLLEKPDEILKDLLIETMEGKWEFKPENNLIESFLREQVKKSIIPDESSNGKIKLTINEFNRLAFTRLTEVKIDGLNFESYKWNELYQRILIVVLDSGHNLEKIKAITKANLVRGEKREKGFKFVPSHDFSFQGESTHIIAKYINYCAILLGKQIYIQFEWQENPKAYKPGSIGYLILGQSE